MTNSALEIMSNWPPVSLPERNGKITILDKKTFQTRLEEFRYSLGFLNVRYFHLIKLHLYV